MVHRPSWLKPSLKKHDTGGFARRPISENTDVLTERLQNILVFELHADGSREFRTTSLRALYNHVLTVITTRKSEIHHNTPASPRFLPPPSKTQHFSSLSIPPSSSGHIEAHSHNKCFTTGSLQLEPDHIEEGPAPPAPTGAPYRERLGGYLHPRDMRRLVTPFSSNNVPTLMVRRHVMLLNFDPLRAIVLRDRLLLLVPDGADAILTQLEIRLRGGLEDLEDDVFGHAAVATAPPVYSKSNADKDDFLVDFGRKHAEKEGKSISFDSEERGLFNQSEFSTGITFTYAAPADEGKSTLSLSDTPLTLTKTEQKESNLRQVPPLLREKGALHIEAITSDEWHDIDNRRFTQLPFELLAVDVVLESVVSLLRKDAKKLCDNVETIIKLITTEGKRKRIHKGQNNYEKLRTLKDQVKETQSRIKGFERAISQVLNEDSDMALMNLSRLLTNPERFVFPVSQQILSEEADEPELILEAYLEQAFSSSNSLELIEGKIATTEGLVEIKLDTIRNRLIFLNTFFSLIMVFLGAAGTVGSIFGMNLLNYLEDDPTAFNKVCFGTVGLGFVIFCLVCFIFWKESTWLLHS